VTLFSIETLENAHKEDDARYSMTTQANAAQIKEFKCYSHHCMAIFKYYSKVIIFEYLPYINNNYRYI
jgi:hypothetical protein